MTNKHTLGGKPPQTGHNVSHSNRKTIRRWHPNIQTKSLFSEVLGRSIRMTITTETLRTVDRAGGLDHYLRKTPDSELNGAMRRIKEQIESRSV